MAIESEDFYLLQFDRCCKVTFNNFAERRFTFMNEADHLVPDPQVEKEFGVTSMTVWRWDNDPELGFPLPILIRGRKYRSRKELESFKQRLMSEALKKRKRTA
jgi:predicted DNA-binding transcriptional regulator AlpA